MNIVENKLPVQLGRVQETLLIPLWARAVETQKTDPIISDPLSLSMLKQIDYDFDKLRHAQGSQLGVCLRGLLFDAWVKSFWVDNPEGTVVEIGAGLNTRMERVDNGCGRWIDLDLPDATALRERFFEPSPRRQLVAGSVLEEDWLRVAKTWGNSPFLFMAEGVLMFFTEAEVKQLLRLLSKHFPGSLLAFDSISLGGIRNQRKHDSLKHFSACLRWGIDNIREIEKWDPGYQVIDIKTFWDIPPKHRKHFKWWMWLLYTIPAFKYAYRLSLVRLG